MRFDRTAGGHLILKVELKWLSDQVVVGDSMSNLVDLAREVEESFADGSAPDGVPNGDSETAR